MSSDDVGFFTIDKDDILAFKRTAKHEFLTTSASPLHAKSTRMQFLDFWYISSFHACVPLQPKVLKVRTIRF